MKQTIFSLQHIPEMRPQPLEHNRAGDEEKERHAEKIWRRLIGFPEPDMIDEGIAIAFDNVEHGIELENIEVLLRNLVRRPEDRRKPEPKLQHHRDKVADIGYEHLERGRQPGNPQQQQHKTKHIVRQLKPVNRRTETVKQKCDQQHRHQAKMDDERRTDRHERQNTDTKRHLLDQKGIGEDSIGTGGSRVGEKEPGDHSRHQPEKKRHSAGRRSCPETDLENEPDDEHERQRLQKRPYRSEI